MNIIKINIDELTGNSSDLQRKIESLEHLNTQLVELISKIESSWDGDASIAYINTMRRYQKQSEKMIKVLTEFKSYVDNTVILFNSVDKDCANKIRGSF